MFKKKTSKEEVKLHPLYALEYWKLYALFEEDEDFIVGELDDENKSCIVKVKDAEKGMLFISMLKTKELKVSVVLDKDLTEYDLAILFDTNPHFSRLYSKADPPFNYMATLFEDKAIHYFSDDLYSPTGHTAILPEQLVRELFPQDLNIKTEITDF